VALPQHIFDAYTETSEIIFEPFCGSGTGLLAAQKTNRQMRAVEIAPEYVDVAIKRFQQNHPDLPVTLIGSGDTFEQVSFKRQLRPSTGVINEIV
jgi:DNA modification methylase